MEFGYCFWYKDGDISSIPHKLKTLGLDYAEVSLTYPWPETIPSEETEKAVQKLNQHGVHFSFHGPLEGLLLYNPRKEIVDAGVEVHKKCIEYASSFDPLYYNFHIKANSMTLNTEGKVEAYSRCLEALDEIMETCCRFNVMPVIENSTSTSFLVPLGELLSRGFYFNLDVGHWFRGGRGYDELSDLVDVLDDRLVLLHLHDARFSKEAVDHLQLGDGEIDFSRVFEILKRTGLKWITLETMPSENQITVPDNLIKAKRAYKT